MPSNSVETSGYTFVNPRSTKTGTVNTPQLKASMPRLPITSYDTMTHNIIPTSMWPTKIEGTSAHKVIWRR